MTPFALAVALTLLAGLSLLQILVACGLPYGRFVWGGGHRVLPTRLRIGSAVSVVLCGGFAALLLARTGVLPGRESGFVVVATWVLFAYFAVGIVMNLASRSRAERWTMTPACVILAAATLVVATSG